VKGSFTTFSEWRLNANIACMNEAPPPLTSKGVLIDPDGSTTDIDLSDALSHWAPKRPPRDYQEASWDAERCVVELSSHLREGSGDIEVITRTMNRLDCWRQCIEHVTREAPDQAVGAGLRSWWEGSGLTSGPHGISAALKNDIVIFADALRRHLPSYDGPGMTLYRGQLESRHRAGIFGISWTSELAVARTFATYHSAEEGPAVVLRIDAEASRIIAPPSERSRSWKGHYEHEYLIDPRGIQPVVVDTVSV